MNIQIAVLTSALTRQSKALIMTVLAIGVALGIMTLAVPSSAVQVQVTPKNPQLGDTLSIVVQADASVSAPTVTVAQKTYPMFAIGSSNLGRPTFRALVPTTPLDRPGTLPIQVNSNQIQNLSVTLKARSFPTQRIWLPPGKDQDISDAEYNRVSAFKQVVSPEKLWDGPFLRPNKGEITSVYGVRRYYNGVFAQDYYHRGVDYGGGVGSPVIAPAAGRVALVGRESQGFLINGNIIGIDHGQGVTSAYLHLSRINVKEGDFVKPGQVIGAVGATGAVTGPHLHWGLYVSGLSVDPAPWRNKGLK